MSCEKLFMAIFRRPWPLNSRVAGRSRGLVPNPSGSYHLNSVEIPFLMSWKSLTRTIERKRDLKSKNFEDSGSNGKGYSWAWAAHIHAYMVLSVLTRFKPSPRPQKECHLAGARVTCIIGRLIPSRPNRDCIPFPFLVDMPQNLVSIDQSLSQIIDYDLQKSTCHFDTN